MNVVQLRTTVRHDYAKPDPAWWADWIGTIAAVALMAGLAWRLM